MISWLFLVGCGVGAPAPVVAREAMGQADVPAGHVTIWRSPAGCTHGPDAATLPGCPDRLALTFELLSPGKPAVDRIFLNGDIAWVHDVDVSTDAPELAATAGGEVDVVVGSAGVGTRYAVAWDASGRVHDHAEHDLSPPD